jgi:hypothetical protein
MRGPLVYSFEGADNSAAVRNLVIAPGTQFSSEYRSDLLGGVTVLQATATGVFQSPANEVFAAPFKATAVPYYANANRGTCPLQVWMPEARDGCNPQKQE